jgi:hypothetical protein
MERITRKDIDDLLNELDARAIAAEKKKLKAAAGRAGVSSRRKTEARSNAGALRGNRVYTGAAPRSGG